VTQVLPDGPAALAGVLKGDVITTVQRERGRETWFQRPEDLAGLVVRLASGAALTIEVWRDIDGDGIYFEKDAARDYSERFRGPLTLR
jgi:S1-C subfamily serine protease